MKDQFISLKEVKPLDNFLLEIIFSTNEKKIFDAKPYLDMGVFKQLKIDNLFKSAKVMNKTVTWCNGEIDIAPYTLYLKSVAI